MVFFFYPRQTGTFRYPESAAPLMNIASCSYYRYRVYEDLIKAGELLDFSRKLTIYPIA